MCIGGVAPQGTHRPIASFGSPGAPGLCWQMASYPFGSSAGSRSNLGSSGESERTTVPEASKISSVMGPVALEGVTFLRRH